MKKIINKFGKYLLLIVAAVAISSLTSCKDDKDDFLNPYVGYTGQEAELVGTWTGSSYNSDPYALNNDAITMVFTQDGKMVFTYKSYKDDKNFSWVFSGTDYKVGYGNNEWIINYTGFLGNRVDGKLSGDPVEINVNDQKFQFVTLTLTDEYGEQYDQEFLLFSFNGKDFRVSK